LPAEIKDLIVSQLAYFTCSDVVVAVVAWVQPGMSHLRQQQQQQQQQQLRRPRNDFNIFCR